MVDSRDPTDLLNIDELAEKVISENKDEQFKFRTAAGTIMMFHHQSVLDADGCFMQSIAPGGVGGGKGVTSVGEHKYNYENATVKLHDA